MKRLLWTYLLYNSDFWNHVLEYCFANSRIPRLKKKSVGLDINCRITKQINQTIFQMTNITSLKEENRKTTFEYNIYRTVNNCWTLINGTG